MDFALVKYKRDKQRFDEQLEHLDELRETLDGNVTGNYSGMRSSGHLARGTESRLLRYDSAVAAATGALADLIELRLEADDELALIENIGHREILRCLYVDGMTWETTAKSVGLTTRCIAKRRAAGLDELRLKLETTAEIENGN